MRENILTVYSEHKTDMYFATTFGFLIPIIYPVIDNFYQNFSFKFFLNLELSLILLTGYAISNLIYFKEKKIKNLFSNFLGILSYTFLAIPVYKLATYYVSKEINLSGLFLCILITIFLKFVKNILDNIF